MKKNLPLELRVGVDVGCHSHNVAIGLSSGEILEEFSIAHNPEGFWSSRFDWTVIPVLSGQGFRF
jgi:hypothetical protein